MGDATVSVDKLAREPEPGEVKNATEWHKENLKDAEDLADVRVEFVFQKVREKYLKKEKYMCGSTSELDILCKLGDLILVFVGVQDLVEDYKPELHRDETSLLYGFLVFLRLVTLHLDKLASFVNRCLEKLREQIDLVNPKKKKEMLQILKKSLNEMRNGMSELVGSSLEKETSSTLGKAISGAKYSKRPDKVEKLEKAKQKYADRDDYNKLDAYLDTYVEEMRDESSFASQMESLQRSIAFPKFGAALTRSATSAAAAKASGSVDEEDDELKEEEGKVIAPEPSNANENSDYYMTFTLHDIFQKISGLAQLDGEFSSLILQVNAELTKVLVMIQKDLRTLEAMIERCNTIRAEEEDADKKMKNVLDGLLGEEHVPGLLSKEVGPVNDKIDCEGRTEGYLETSERNLTDVHMKDVFPSSRGETSLFRGVEELDSIIQNALSKNIITQNDVDQLETSEDRKDYIESFIIHNLQPEDILEKASENTTDITQFFNIVDFVLETYDAYNTERKKDIFKDNDFQTLVNEGIRKFGDALYDESFDLNKLYYELRNKVVSTEISEQILSSLDYNNPVLKPTQYLDAIDLNMLFQNQNVDFAKPKKSTDPGGKVFQAVNPWLRTKLVIPAKEDDFNKFLTSFYTGIKSIKDKGDEENKDTTQFFKDIKTYYKGLLTENREVEKDAFATWTSAEDSFSMEELMLSLINEINPAMDTTLRDEPVFRAMTDDQLKLLLGLLSKDSSSAMKNLFVDLVFGEDLTNAKTKLEEEIGKDLKATQEYFRKLRLENWDEDPSKLEIKYGPFARTNSQVREVFQLIRRHDNGLSPAKLEHVSDTTKKKIKANMLENLSTAANQFEEGKKSGDLTPFVNLLSSFYDEPSDSSLTYAMFLFMHYQFFTKDLLVDNTVRQDFQRKRSSSTILDVSKFSQRNSFLPYDFQTATGYPADFVNKMLIIAPTGSGKSIMYANVARRLLWKGLKKVYIVTASNFKSQIEELMSSRFFADKSLQEMKDLIALRKFEYRSGNYELTQVQDDKAKISIKPSGSIPIGEFGANPEKTQIYFVNCEEEPGGRTRRENIDALIDKILHEERDSSCIIFDEYHKMYGYGHDTLSLLRKCKYLVGLTATPFVGMNSIPFLNVFKTNDIVQFQVQEEEYKCQASGEKDRIIDNLNILSLETSHNLVNQVDHFKGAKNLVFSLNSVVITDKHLSFGSYPHVYTKSCKSSFPLIVMENEITQEKSAAADLHVFTTSENNTSDRMNPRDDIKNALKKIQKWIDNLCQTRFKNRRVVVMIRNRWILPLQHEFDAKKTKQSRQVRNLWYGGLDDFETNLKKINDAFEYLPLRNPDNNEPGEAMKQVHDEIILYPSEKTEGHNVKGVTGEIIVGLMSASDVIQARGRIRRLNSHLRFKKEKDRYVEYFLLLPHVSTRSDCTRELRDHLCKEIDFLETFVNHLYVSSLLRHSLRGSDYDFAEQKKEDDQRRFEALFETPMSKQVEEVISEKTLLMVNLGNLQEASTKSALSNSYYVSNGPDDYGEAQAINGMDTEQRNPFFYPTVNGFPTRLTVLESAPASFPASTVSGFGSMYQLDQDPTNKTPILQEVGPKRRFWYSDPLYSQYCIKTELDMNEFWKFTSPANAITQVPTHINQLLTIYVDPAYVYEDNYFPVEKYSRLYVNKFNRDTVNVQQIDFDDENQILYTFSGVYPFSLEIGTDIQKKFKLRVSRVVDIEKNKPVWESKILSFVILTNMLNKITSTNDFADSLFLMRGISVINVAKRSILEKGRGLVKKSMLKRLEKDFPNLNGEAFLKKTDEMGDLTGKKEDENIKYESCGDILLVVVWYVIFSNYKLKHATIKDGGNTIEGGDEFVKWWWKRLEDAYSLQGTGNDQKKKSKVLLLAWWVFGYGDSKCMKAIKDAAGLNLTETGIPGNELLNTEFDNFIKAIEGDKKANNKMTRASNHYYISEDYTRLDFTKL